MFIQDSDKGIVYGDPALQKQMGTVMEINPIPIAQSAEFPRLHQERRCLGRLLTEALLGFEDSKEKLWREGLSWR